MQTLLTATRRSWLYDLIALASLLGLVYFFHLGHYALFTPDEGRYSEVAREMLASHDYITPRVDGVAFLDKPVLYYWLQAIAIHCFGLREWSLRFFPAILGILGCLLTYVTGRLCFNRRTGLLSCLILATMPLYFGGSHYADLNLEVAVFITASLQCFILGINRHGRARFICLIAAYTLAAFACLTKGLIGIAFPTLIIGCWMLLSGRLKELTRISLPTGILLFLLITLPWYWLVQQKNPGFFHYFFVTQHITRFLSTGEFNNKTPVWFYVPILIAGLFPWTIFLPQTLWQALRSQPKHRSTCLFLIVWASIIFIFFSIPQSKSVGYIIPVQPPIALLMGYYLSTIWEIKGRFWISLTALGLGCLLISLFFLLAPTHQWLGLNQTLLPYYRVIASICLIVTIIAVSLLAKTRRISSIFFTCFGFSIATLFVIMMSANRINLSSTKPIALYLKEHHQSTDEIVTYFTYYQDLPLYLEQRVTIVANWQSPKIPQRDNWVRELWFGLPFQDTSAWLIDQQTFLQRWQSHKRLFVLLNNNYLPQFKKQVPHYTTLMTSHDMILVTNQM